MLYQYTMERIRIKFEPWLAQLENACIVGKRDVREVAICSCTGPVLEVISSIDPTELLSVYRDELRRCFSPNKTRVPATNLLNSFRPQHATENLRSYIHQYSKIHRQATGLQPEEDYDLGRKVEFMKRLRNPAIANKIIKSQQFQGVHPVLPPELFCQSSGIGGGIHGGRGGSATISPSFHFGGRSL